MILIKKNDIVLLVGAIDSGKTTFAKKLFNNQEILIVKTMYEQMIGETYNGLYEEKFIDILVDIIKLKKEHGQRVVILSPVDIVFFEKIIEYFDPIIIKIDSNQSSNFFLQEKSQKIYKGFIKDKSAYIYRSKFQVAQSGLKYIKQYSGITVIPDIHGDVVKLKSAVKWAYDRNNYIVFLGDIIDHGENSFDCLEIVFNLVNNGKAINIIGNHDKKFFNWSNKNNVFLNDGNTAIYEYQKLKESEQEYIKYMSDFLYHNGYYHYVFENIVFSHGGFAEKLLYVSDKKIYGKLQQVAMVGETTDDGNKKYGWIENIPSGITSIVGHDIRSNIPYTETNSNGGKVIFMDCGCGKGGVLFTIDISKTGEILNTNMW